MSQPGQIRAVRVGTSSTFTPVHVGADRPTPAEVVVGVNRPELLEDLGDVEGTSAAAEGTVLTKRLGTWRGLPPEVTAQYVHEQPVAATVWQITHGLGRRPATVALFSADWTTPYAQYLIQHLDADSLRVSMDQAAAGVALVE